MPILFLLALSLCSEAKLFVPRYYLWGVPGLVILVASAMSAVHPLPARRVLGLTILLAFCLRRLPIGDAGHAGEDWRGALRTARAAAEQFDATILLRSGFPEMPMVRDGHDSIVEDPLMAPLAMYPVPVKSVRMLPCWLTGTDRRRLEEIVSGLIGRRSTFVFISPSEGPPTATWLLGRLSGEDYRISTLGPFTGMTTIVFQPRGVHAKK